MYENIGSQSGYTGSTANGVTSQNYGSYNGMILKPWDGSVKPKSCFGQTGQAYCVGQGCTRSSGSIWGSNPYTTDAPRCQAARHAGVIGPAGGFFQIEDVGRVDSFTGSTGSGSITTQSYGAYGGIKISPASGAAPVAAPAPTPAAAVPAATVPAATPVPSGGSTFQVGQKVKAKYRGSPTLATVQKCNGNGTYAVKFDDYGAVENNAKEAEMQLAPAAEVITSMTKDMESQKRYLEMNLPPNNRVDLNGAGRYLTKIQELTKTFQTNAAAALLGSEGEAAVQKWVDYCDTQLKKIAEIQEQDKLKEVTTAIDRTKYWLDNSIRDSKISDADKYFGQLETALKDKDAILQASEVGQQYLMAMDKYKEECLLKMAQNKLKDTASNILRTVESHLRWLNSYKDKGDTNKAAEYWKKAQDEMAPILADDRYQELQNVKDMMTKYRATEEQFGGDIDKIKRKQALEQAVSELKSKGRWLQNGLNDKNLDYCSKYSAEFRPMFDTFENEFGAEPDAKETITWGRDLLERVDNEVGPMMNKRDAEALLGPGNFSLRWLNGALDDKNEHRAVEYRDKLIPSMESLRDPRYTVIPEVAEFLKKADEAMERMDNELGDIIAGKEITELGRDAANQLRYLESYLNAKNVDSIQNYLEKAQKVQAALQRYTKYSEAKDILQNIEALVQRVDSEMGDIIAGNQIEAISRDLEWPLKNLERAIQNREVGNIIQGKERVLELSAALVPFSANPAASSVNERVQRLLGLCEGEVATIIADSKVAEAQNSFNSLLAISKQAQSAGDARVIATNSLKLATLVYPLRVQYGRFPKVQAMVNEVDNIIKSNGIKMNDYQKQKFDALKSSLAPQITALHNSTGNQLANGLKEVNKQLQNIRKQSLNDPEVLSYLTEVDTINLKVFGRIPAEDEYLPIVELDMKAPYAVQNQVKACNKTAEEINKQLVECKTDFSKVDVTGATLSLLNVWLDSSHHSEKSLQQKVEAAERAVKEFEEKQISALKELDPNCPALSMYPDSIEHIFKTTKQWKIDWPAAINYGIANAKAQHWLKNVRKTVEHSSNVSIEDSRNWSFSASHVLGFMTYRDYWAGGETSDLTKIYVACLNTADQGIKAAKAAKELREDHPEANLIQSQLEKLKSEAQNNGVSTLEKLIQHDTQLATKEFDDYDYENRRSIEVAKMWIAALKELVPGHSVVAFEKTLSEAETWVNEAKQRKEAAAKAKREKEAAERALANQRMNQTHKTPYSGGIIECVHSKWRYDGDKGTLTNIGGDTVFTGWTATWNMNGGRGVSMDLYFYPAPSAPYNMPNGLVWHLWGNGSMDCFYTSPSIDNSSSSHCVASIPAANENGRFFSNAFDIKQTRVEGSVPPPIAAAVTGLKYALQRCQAQNKTDKLTLRKIHWKKLKFEKLKQTWPDCCRGCNSSGHNLYFCFDCEKSYCSNSNCKGDGSSNVCPFCSQYNGGVRPSWPSALKDPRDIYNWERQLEELKFEDDNIWPKWAQWLENVRL